MLSRQTLLLKPMQTAARGFARVQTENGRALVQLHARGLEGGVARVFGYLDGHAARELGSVPVNPNGEASLEAEAPANLQGLIVIGAPATPLLIALCGKQDAGGLLDVKNAALALCEKLDPSRAAPSRRTRPEAPVKPVSQALHVSQVLSATQAAGAEQALPVSPASAASSAVPVAQALPVGATPPVSRAAPHPAPLPREIFLPALDPAPYVPAGEPTSASAAAPARREGPAVDRLRPLAWPRGFATLKAYFATRKPVAVLPWPGWRFVSAASGLWLGVQVWDGQARRVAYVYSGPTPPDARGCRDVTGTDGRTYHVLVQTPRPQ